MENVLKKVDTYYICEFLKKINDEYYFCAWLLW